MAEKLRERVQIEAFKSSLLKSESLFLGLKRAKGTVQVFALPEDQQTAHDIFDPLNDLAEKEVFVVVDVCNDVLLPGQQALYEGQSHAKTNGISVVIMPSIYNKNDRNNTQMERFFYGADSVRERDMRYVTLSTSTHKTGFLAGVLASSRYNLDDFDDSKEAVNMIVTGIAKVS